VWKSFAEDLTPTLKQVKTIIQTFVIELFLYSRLIVQHYDIEYHLPNEVLPPLKIPFIDCHANYQLQLTHTDHSFQQFK
jgi:hypothetical protein